MIHNFEKILKKNEIGEVSSEHSQDINLEEYLKYRGQHPNNTDSEEEEEDEEENEQQEKVENEKTKENEEHKE